MQTPSLMQRAKGGDTAGFKRPSTAQFVPPDQKDAVDRISAAGMKIMYSPEMREELKAEVARDVPPAQKMAEAVVGLMLTLDKQTKGGIPMPALFPAALDLLGEAAEVLTTAGQPVTQADYNEAAQMMFVLMARKLGAKDEEIMGEVEKMTGGQPGGEMEPGEGAGHEQAEAPAMEQQETQAEAQGLPEPDEQMRRA